MYFISGLVPSQKLSFIIYVNFNTGKEIVAKIYDTNKYFSQYADDALPS